MMTRLRSYTDAIPTPLAGLALGIASLGWSLENALPLDGRGQATGASIAAVMLLCFFAKFVLRPRLLLEDLQHPVLGSILPTSAMALMIISKAIAPWGQEQSEMLWLAAIALHLCLLGGFVFFRLRRVKLAQMVPSWFIPPVGIAVAALASPEGNFHTLAYVLLVFGLINFTLLFPLMIYRFLFRQEVPDAAKPTIAIFAAPASLSLAGYMTMESEPSLLLCSILLGIAMLMTLVIYIALLRLLRLPFSPGYASFTFPLVIGATALYKIAGYLEGFAIAKRYAAQLHQLATLELVIAAGIIAYVCLRYVMYYAHLGPRTKEKAHAKPEGKIAPSLRG